MANRVRMRWMPAALTSLVCLAAVGVLVSVAGDQVPRDPVPVGARPTVAATPNPTQATRSPIQIEAVASGMEWTPEQRIQRAPLIVRGVVSATHPSRWNTPSGELPPGTTPETISRSDLVIYTDYTIAVERVLRGTLPDDTVRVRITGGSVGQDSYIHQSEPVLEEGQRVVLLLVPDDYPATGRVGPDHYRILRGYWGQYKIVGDNAVAENARGRAQRKGSTNAGWVVHELPLAQLEALIRANPHRPEPRPTSVP